MNSSEPSSGADNLASIVTETITSLQEGFLGDLDATDLARLAQMHTHCETLLEVEEDQLSQAGVERKDLVKALHDALQALILGEHPNSDAVIEVIPEAIAELSESGAPRADDLIAQLDPNEAPAGSASKHFQPQFEALNEALSNPPALDDLPALAAVHTLVEQVQQVVGGESELTPIAKLLNQAFSGLILDEIDDPSRVLEGATNAVGRCLEFIADPGTDLSSIQVQLESFLEFDETEASDFDDVGADEAEAEAPVEILAESAQPVEAVEAEPVAPPVEANTSTAAIEVESYQSEPLKVDLDDRENLEGFVEEANEHLATIEDKLLDVEKDPTNADTLNELFRPFHTIKGIAGFLNLRDINCLTHEAETILDMGRKGTLRITNAHVDLILATIDILKVQIGMLAQYMRDPEGDSCPQPPCSDMIVKLRRVAAGEAAESITGTEQSSSAVAEANTPQGSSKDEPPTEAAPSVNAHVGELTIRVDTAKLDALVDTVGELVIAQTMVNLHETVDTSEELRRTVTQVTKIVRDVQEASMAMRMVPVGNTFQKMKRVVRDVSRKAGKNVGLELKGEETELDKNVIQQVSDPLVHMVRNSVDHGIEPPEERRAVGKPEEGTVTLDAYHEGDNVIIEIRDDGRGLDPQKLIKKGVERGLIAPEAQISDQEAFALIMEPGFSTAQKLTDISGRGVGMDVVRRNVEELRGKLEIDSKLGEGSTFRIRLPLTLAIIDGMLVRVGKERMVVPTIMIEQSLRPDPEQIATVQNRGEMLQVRGEFCPLIQVGQHFGYSGRVEPADALVVVSAIGSQKIGLVVDELIGQQQIVIKSLGDRFKTVQGVSGAAILGDGQVGLIVEPAGLLKLYNFENLHEEFPMGIASQSKPIEVEETVEQASNLTPEDSLAEAAVALENE